MRSRMLADHCAYLANVDLRNDVGLEGGAEQRRIGRATLAVQVDHRRLDRRVSHPCLHLHEARATIDRQTAEGVAKVVKPERSKSGSVTGGAVAFTNRVAVQLPPRKRSGKDQIVLVRLVGSPCCERLRKLRDQRQRPALAVLGEAVLSGANRL